MSASRARQRSIYSISEYGNISPLMSRVTPWDPYSPWIRNTPMGEARISVPLLRTTSSRPLAGPHAPNIRSVDREQVYICKREVSLYSFSRKRSNLALWIWFPSKRKKKKKKRREERKKKAKRKETKEKGKRSWSISGMYISLLAWMFAADFSGCYLEGEILCTHTYTHTHIYMCILYILYITYYICTIYIYICMYVCMYVGTHG